MPTDTGFGPGTSVQTPRTVIYGAFSTIVPFEITIGNVKVTLDSPPTTGLGDITFNFTLSSHKSPTGSVELEYSTDGKQTWSKGASAGDDSGQNSLTVTVVGNSYTFIWDTVLDLGIDFKGDVHVRMKAFDLVNQGGDFMLSTAAKVAVDNAPLAPSIVTPIVNVFCKDDTFTFEMLIPNPSKGNSDMHAKLDVDTTNTFDSQNGQALRTWESRLDQTGWEYDSDGAGAFLPIPVNGLPIVATPALIGRTVRFTVPTEDKLPTANLFMRAVFGGVV